MQSSVLEQSKQDQLPEETLDGIIRHVVGECYLRDHSFSLHLNLTFMLMIHTNRAACH